MTDDTSPPHISTREDCARPMACPCDPEGPCQVPLLPKIMKERPAELEMPERGLNAEG